MYAIRSYYAAQGERDRHRSGFRSPCGLFRSGKVRHVRPHGPYRETYRLYRRPLRLPANAGGADDDADIVGSDHVLQLFAQFLAVFITDAT